MSNVKIYVATHKRDDNLLKIPYSYYIPIHCGKEIYKEENTGEFLPKLGDNTGDNISVKNPNYCELTAMYWIWKNDDSQPNDIVGLNHYRRYFSEEFKEDSEILTRETIQKWLEDYDFLVNGCSTAEDYTISDEESVYRAYENCHVINDLDIALEAIELYYPLLYDIINHEIKHSGAMCLCNMLITRKKYFDEYCEFLFTVMAYVESKINLNDEAHEGYNARVFGFLGERLFRPWLKATGYSGRPAPVLNWEVYSGYKWN
jgi:hypothetical protein